MAYHVSSNNENTSIVVATNSENTSDLLSEITTEKDGYSSKRIDGFTFFDLLNESLNNERLSKLKVVRPKDRPEHQQSNQISTHNMIGDFDCDKEVVEITTQVRNYSMNICKQMKKKLLYIDRDHFKVRNDRGSMAK